MNRAFEQLTKILDENNMHYDATRVDERDCVSLRFGAENFGSLPLQFDFDKEDNGNISIKSFDICKINKENSVKMLLALNALNNKYRYITFAMDFAENEKAVITASVDITVAPENEYEMINLYIYRFTEILNDAYPIIMKTAYSE